jgi:Flp pilus assembly pilin Flp
MRTRIQVRKEDGAAAVEFALIVGVLSLLIFGMMEYGLAFTQMQSLKAGAREGARTAAVRANRATIEAALNSGTGGSLNGYSAEEIRVNGGSPISGSGPFCTNNTSGQSVSVTIPTGSGSSYPSELGSGISEAFQIDIPFMPHLNLHPTISGSFRCE